MGTAIPPEPKLVCSSL